MLEQPLNREERRRLKHKRGKARPAPGHHRYINPNALRPLDDSQPHGADRVMNDFLRIEAAYGRLKDGAADWNDFDLIAVSLNLAYVRAKEISDDLHAMLQPSIPAMSACKARMEKHGRSGFDGPGLIAMREALDINEEIVKNSSRKQMNMAADACARIEWRQLLNKKRQQAKETA